MTHYFDCRVDIPPNHFKSVDEREKIGVVILENEDGDEEEHQFPIKFEVCPVCEGTGSHVNPDIDAHGLSREDFDNDPGFEEDYFSGVYDVSCNRCHGKRVVPEINREILNPVQKEILAACEVQWELDAEYDTLCRAERRMGA